MELDDGLDDLLADICEPLSPKRSKTEQDNPQPGTSNEPQSKPASSKTNCVLVSQKQVKKNHDKTSEIIRCVKMCLDFFCCRAAHSCDIPILKKGNPLLKCITGVAWEYDDIIPDYEIGKTIGILFLSIRYHNMNPDYIHTRLKELGKKYDLRVLLVQVDLKDPLTPLKHITRICLLTDLTLMLAWSAEEAAKVIENYKIFESKPPDKIMEKIENDPHQKIINALTSVRSVNKTDAMTLITTFGTLENIIKASEQRLAECPGFGVTKAKKLFTALHQTFLKRPNLNIEKSEFEGDISVEDVERLESEIGNELDSTDKRELEKLQSEICKDTAEKEEICEAKKTN